MVSLTFYPGEEVEFLFEYGLFLAKVVTVALAAVFVIGLAFMFGQRGAEQESGDIRVQNLNERFKKIKQTMELAVLEPEAAKAAEKRSKKDNKAERKQKKKAAGKPSDESARKRMFVLKFDGDLRASAVNRLRKEITAVLSLAAEKDEVVLCLESAGGLVHSYGLAASQLSRIRDKKVALTICVDKVAASGGYMMACVGQKIVAAPFAVLGSIGVVAQLPNFHKVLKKNDVDFEVLTAGEYKRTLTVFGENTDQGRNKFIDDLETTHHLFKEFVSSNRPQLDMSLVGTGEVWYGSEAMDKGLVDQLGTSDDYLLAAVNDADLYSVSYKQKKKLAQRVGLAAHHAIDRFLLSWWQRATQRWF